jgi:hypothetical protein
MEKKILTNDELLSIAETHARAVLLGGKAEMMPIAHMIKANGEELILATPWRNDFEKQLTQRMLSQLMKKGDVIRYAVVCEAWAAAAMEGEAETVKPGDVVTPAISKRPDAREIVMAIAVDANGSNTRVLVIKRDANGACVDLVVEADATDFIGPLTDLLRPEGE